MTHTFALVNCTIGPSSDTTWFPTWIKGILPAERQRKRTETIKTITVTFAGASKVPLTPKPKGSQQ